MSMNQNRAAREHIELADHVPQKSSTRNEHHHSLKNRLPLSKAALLTLHAIKLYRLQIEL